jgi:perosamine synthetase
MKVPLVRPSVGEAEVQEVARVLRSGWITQGPEVAAFEADFAKSVYSTHAIAVSNCTVALQLALIGVGVSRGDDVVTVSHSFVATANAVVAIGARPVFVDVVPETLGIDPAQLETRITPQTRAILCVHQVGIPCDVEGVLAVANRKGLPVVEDAACAIGSEVLWKGRWERIGLPHGRVACFSFHPRKIITTGDGGMLTTADAGLAQRFRLLRQHAMSVPDTIRHHSKEVTFEEYREPAFNFRLTDIQAAVGRSQLRNLDAFLAERRQQAKWYQEAFAAVPHLCLLREPENSRWNWQSFPVVLKETGGLTQKRAMQYLLDNGVASKRGIGNSHQEPAYNDRRRWSCGVPKCEETALCEHLVVSERLRDTVIFLPIFQGMTPEEHAHVVATCKGLASLI